MLNGIWIRKWVVGFVTLMGGPVTFNLGNVWGFVLINHFHMGVYDQMVHFHYV